jgi:hypothetical protein
VQGGGRGALGVEYFVVLVLAQEVKRRQPSSPALRAAAVAAAAVAAASAALARRALVERRALARLGA